MSTTCKAASGGAAQASSSGRWGALLAGDSIPPNACSRIPHLQSAGCAQARAAPARNALASAGGHHQAANATGASRTSEPTLACTRAAAEDKTLLPTAAPPFGSAADLPNCALLNFLLAPFCDLLVFVMPPVGKHGHVWCQAAAVRRSSYTKTEMPHYHKLWHLFDSLLRNSCLWA